MAGIERWVVAGIGDGVPENGGRLAHVRHANLTDPTFAGEVEVVRADEVADLVREARDLLLRAAPSPSDSWEARRDEWLVRVSNCNTAAFPRTRRPEERP